MKKNTKKALLLSICSIVICTAMLIGSTFAWFTDNASTSVNTIKAGTLKLDIQNEAGESIVGQTMNFIKAAGHEGDPILWEPGCTYNLPEFKIVNIGNLALKYKIIISGIMGDAKLNEAIEWTIGGAAEGTEYKLPAGGSSEPITVSGHMKESAGNEYQGLSIEGAAITVVAAQDTVEYDSTTNQYDKDAAYPVAGTDQQTAAAGQETILTVENAEGEEVARVTLPADAVAPGTPLTLTVTEAADTHNIAVEDGQEKKTYDIKVEGIEGLGVDAEVRLYIGPDRTDIKLYHEADEVPTFDYDSITGYLTFHTTEFSLFTVLSRACTYPEGITGADFPDGMIVVDNAGSFYPTFKEAMETVADGGTLYFLNNSTVEFSTHLDVTKNITIYGNDADFLGRDISIGTSADPVNPVTNVNIHETKNLVVWGQPKALGNTWNVNFYHVSNAGCGLLMYRDGYEGTDLINMTATDCFADGIGSVSDAIHTTADGSITLKNCVIQNFGSALNIAHKQEGSMDITVENSRFISCGKVCPENDYFAPLRFVANNIDGTVTAVLKNNQFAETVGTNGDILLGDYRPDKNSHAVTAEIVTEVPVMLKDSTAAPRSFAGGTVILPD